MKRRTQVAFASGSDGGHGPSGHSQVDCDAFEAGLRRPASSTNVAAQMPAGPQPPPADVIGGRCSPSLRPSEQPLSARDCSTSTGRLWRSSLCTQTSDRRPVWCSPLLALWWRSSNYGSHWPSTQAIKGCVSACSAAVRNQLPPPPSRLQTAASCCAHAAGCPAALTDCLRQPCQPARSGRRRPPRRCPLVPLLPRPRCCAAVPLLLAVPRCGCFAARQET